MTSFDDATAEVPPSPCPGCGTENDMATSATGADKPHPGSISVCFRCGHISAFDEALRLRNLTDQEMHDVAGHPVILAIQKARKKVMQ